MRVSESIVRLTALCLVFDKRIGKVKKKKEREQEKGKRKGGKINIHKSIFTKSFVVATGAARWPHPAAHLAIQTLFPT